MSRYTQYGASADPLQPSRMVTVAQGKRPHHSHALHDGLAAIAPRLALVFLVASAVQMLLHWTGR